MYILWVNSSKCKLESDHHSIYSGQNIDDCNSLVLV